jgi:hypothetical protein
MLKSALFQMNRKRLGHSHWASLIVRSSAVGDDLFYPSLYVVLPALFELSHRSTIAWSTMITNGASAAFARFHY